MTVCLVCGCKEFHVDSGLFYCQECGTQFKEFREEEKDDEGEAYTSSASEIRTPTKKRKKKSSEKDDRRRAWFTNEAFNIILCNQVRSLIAIGVSPALKEAVLQMWALFLQASEACFKNDSGGNSWMPSLGHSFRGRDMQILCGETKLKARKLSKRRKRRKKVRNTNTENGNNVDNNLLPNFEQINEAREMSDLNPSGSESDISTDASVAFEENGSFPKRSLNYCKRNSLFRLSYGSTGIKCMKRMRKSSRRKLDFMSLSKTLSFLYLGLLLTEDFLLLGDLLRLVRDGSVPFIDAFQYLGPDMKLQQSDRMLLSGRIVPKMKDLIAESTKIAKFLKLSELKHRPLLPIVASFISALHLPSSLLGLIKLFMAKSPIPASWNPSNNNNSSILPYEIKAMAYVLVSLKFLFVLNDDLELTHSTLAREINSLTPPANLFIWGDWFRWLKLQVGFMNTRNINASTINKAINTDNLAQHYCSKMHQWNPKNQPNIPQKCKKQEFRKSLRNTLSSYVNRNQASNPQDLPTNFMLSKRLKDEIKNVNMLQQHSLSPVQELPEHFSQQSLSYFSDFCNEPGPLSNELDKCYSKLQKLFYCDVVESRLQSKKHKTCSSYWFTELEKNSVGKICDTLPQNFRWLLNHASEMVECNICDLYWEVVDIEKKIFEL